MKRISLFFREEQIEKAGKLGKEIDRSLAWVIRRALDFYFEALETTTKKDRKQK
jgi:hypothetical protein